VCAVQHSQLGRHASVGDQHSNTHATSVNMDRSAVQQLLRAR
jgi:hypothetical protein